MAEPSARSDEQRAIVAATRKILAGQSQGEVSAYLAKTFGHVPGIDVDVTMGQARAAIRRGQALQQLIDEQAPPMAIPLQEPGAPPLAIPVGTPEAIPLAVPVGAPEEKEVVIRYRFPSNDPAKRTRDYRIRLPPGSTIDDLLQEIEEGPDNWGTDSGDLGQPSSVEVLYVT